MHPSSSTPHTTVGDSVVDVSPSDRDGAEVAAETTVGDSVVDVSPSDRDGAEVAAETTVGDGVVDVPPSDVGGAEGVGPSAAIVVPIVVGGVVVAWGRPSSAPTHSLGRSGDDRQSAAPMPRGPH
jgi:hypothetical protein